MGKNASRISVLITYRIQHTQLKPRPCSIRPPVLCRSHVLLLGERNYFTFRYFRAPSPLGAARYLPAAPARFQERSHCREAQRRPAPAARSPQRAARRGGPAA